MFEQNASFEVQAYEDRLIEKAKTCRQKSECKVLRSFETIDFKMSLIKLIHLLKR
ncbi:hypothetical protein EV207_10944 [Scopulibacillus darangshiensis]|uniref:Uncharacterized protein n=1 Tax=Scopulibacillus darangshiensis TaxID=442528 RepID=A0A4R2P470_9BACL|nr:hypothetical protein EV207_10944 [Scopulibacillus darangshiensis]